jgi:hypothetical protein
MIFSSKFGKFLVLFSLLFISFESHSNSSAPLLNCSFYLNDPAQLKTKVFDVAFRASNVASFQAGFAQEALDNEQALIDNGIHAVTIINPSVEDIRLLTQHGYSYGPLWLTNHQPMRSYVDYINSIPDSELPPNKKSKRKRNYQRKVDISKTEGYGISVDIGAFTETFFKEWYQIYKDSVLSRKSGVDAAGENFASPEGSSKGNFDNLRALSIRNRAGQLIGGYVLQIIESSTKKILKIRFAAFKEGDMSPNIKYQSLNLGYRAYDEVVKWAMSDKTFTTLSYGSDPNLYCDEIASPGLHQFKRELGFVLLSPLKLSLI